MERFGKYGNWIIGLIFAVIVIAVYKTFDNFSKIIDAVKLVWNALTPFVIGFVVAYILNIPCKKLISTFRNSKRLFLKNHAKALSISIIYLSVLLLLFIVIRSVVPALYKNLVDLYNNAPRYFDEAVSWIVKWQKEYNITIFEVDKLTATNAMNNILNNIDIAQFSKYAQGVVKLTSSAMNLLIGIIASIYMLIEKENIVGAAKRICHLIFKEQTADRIIMNVIRVNEIFSKYIFCLLIDAIMMALLATISLSLLRVRYAIILGTFIGVCNLIPYFGAIIAGVSSVVITIITGGIMKGIWTALVLGVLQQVDGNFIGPKIMGEVLDISPLWIIFAVTLGGGLFGVGGMVVSVPIFIAIKMLASEYFVNLEKRKKGDGNA